MRSVLSVKWKLVIAVVGVSFLCLIGLMFLNRSQAERFLLDNTQALLREASGLEALRYNQAAENITTLLGGLSTRATTELDISRIRNATPDVYRIANFTAACIRDTEKHVRSLGIILKPGVFTMTDESDRRFFNDSGYAWMVFNRSGTDTDAVPPLPAGEIERTRWWQDALEHGLAAIPEPYMTQENHDTSAASPFHVATLFVSPVFEEGEVIGVAFAEVCLTELQRQIQIEANKDKGIGHTITVLISHQGACIGAPKDLDLSRLLDYNGLEGKSLPSLRTDLFPEIAAAIRQNRPYSEVIAPGTDKERIFIATHPIHRDRMDQFWSVMLLQTKNEMLSRTRGAFAQQLKETLLMLVVSIALGYLVAQIMARTLTTTEEWHRTILDRVPMPLGIIDSNSRWIYLNPAIAEAMKHGLAREAMVGMSCRETMVSGEADFIVSSNRPEAPKVATMELVIRTGRIHRISSCQLLDSDGSYLGRLLIGIDVTDAKTNSHTLEMASGIAEDLDIRAGRILEAAQSLSESALQESAAIEEITATTLKMGDAAAEYASSAQTSHSQAEFTDQASSKGAEEAISAAAAMNGVRDSGHKITSIIKLIDDIAFQTNLLALNAAVEAARAGRHGKGFAVVAEEVRNLAGRSAKAARETSGMIEEMTKRIGDATDSIEKLSGTLIEIRENAESLRDNSDEVAKLAQSQSVSVKQVHASLEQISVSVNSTTNVSRETARMAEAVSLQSASLRRLTDEKNARDDIMNAPTRRSHPANRDSRPLLPEETL